MYWINGGAASYTIEKANMDGTGRQSIVTSNTDYMNQPGGECC